MAAAVDASVGRCVNCVGFDSSIPVIDDLLRDDTARKFRVWEIARWCEFDICHHFGGVKLDLNLISFADQVFYNSLYSVGAIYCGHKSDEAVEELAIRSLDLALVAEGFENLHDMHAAWDNDVVSRWTLDKAWEM